MIEDDIKDEEQRIKQLSQNFKQLILPRRSISFQFQNMRTGNRDFTKRRLLIQQQRRIINHEIDKSKRRLVSLREAFLGQT